jgi:hypothetical protein
LSNQEKFTGNFRNDVPHGNGVYYKNDGSVVNGIWKEGKRIE